MTFLYEGNDPFLEEDVAKILETGYSIPCCQEWTNWNDIPKDEFIHFSLIFSPDEKPLLWDSENISLGLEKVNTNYKFHVFAFSSLIVSFFFLLLLKYIITRA